MPELPRSVERPSEPQANELTYFIDGPSLAIEDCFLSSMAGQAPAGDDY
jgi:hypothetical protein